MTVKERVRPSAEAPPENGDGFANKFWGGGVPPMRRQIKRFQAGLVVAETQYYALQTATKIGLASLVIDIEARGLLTRFEEFGRKLYTVTGFGFLGWTEEGARITIAHGVVAFILMVSWLLVGEACRAYLKIESPYVGENNKRKSYGIGISVFAGLTAIVEAMLLYVGQSSAGDTWGGEEVGFDGMALTIACVYVAAVYLMTCVCVALGERVRKKREEIQHYG